MSSTASSDALLCLRRSIAANVPPVYTTSEGTATASELVQDIANASYLQFNHDDTQTFSLSEKTRFESTSGDLDNLRSIYFAWLRKDDAVPEYIAATTKLNEELIADGGAGGSVRNLTFAERMDLITWLEGASNDSEHIKPIDGDAATAQATGATDVASGATGGVATVSSGAPGVGKAIDPRLREIYNGERKMGDRNTILRGIKPTDFSHVRKHAEVFLGKNRKQPNGRPAATQTPSIPPNAALVQNRTKRRLEPIILLSPSASSLLRMSNIKSFLDNGIYEPPESTATSANLLQVTRILPSIDPQRPLRFNLVDSPDQFKPDYWDRLAAVFTTGQTWQFKSYKWQSPPDLFSHALGIYVGWRGEDIPSTVKGWGRGVISAQIDKYNAHQGTQARWRDREVVEGIWKAIEESMRNKGWNRDGAVAGR